MGHPRYSMEEIAERGREIYEKQLRTKLEPDNIDAIDGGEVRIEPRP